MTFSEKELALIAAARKKASDAAIKRWLLLAVMLAGFVLMLLEYIDAARFAYFTVGAVLLSIALPQFGGGPRYEDLVKLLDAKARAKGEA